MQEITRVSASGVDPRAIGSYQPRLQTREDHGPYYLITVGEPIHRVDKRDGVPHLYPMRAVKVGTWANWSMPGYSGPNILMSAQNSSGEKVDANPIFAGDIVNDVLVINPQYAGMGTISIQAFAKKDMDVDEFNALIMPEPVWFDLEEVPAEEVGEYKARFPQIADDIRKEGALLRRERLLREAIARFERGGNQLYAAAAREILAAFETYKRFGLTELGNADRQVQDRDKSGKSIYDRADLRRQWLFARKGIDSPLVEQMQPRIEVTMPASAADVERHECSQCGEMIAVKAKVCRYCGAGKQMKAEGEPPAKRGPKPKVQLTDEPMGE